MTLKEQVEQYRRSLADFNRWEADNPPPVRSPDAILTDLGFLMNCMSKEEIMRDPDPEKLGIQSMRAKLARGLVFDE
jgi:hypothetical protein